MAPDFMTVVPPIMF
uniref:Uncharacterized protein n=1 Tax=Arundo donax TaxID=35708 RepID=A0A0A9C0L8_ARUDO